LTECFKVCDAARGGKLKVLYRKLFNVQAPIEEQVENLLTTYKEERLDELIHEMFPGIDGYHAKNSKPHQQIHHVRSHFIELLASDFGIEGYEAAEADECKYRYSAAYHASNGRFPSPLQELEYVQSIRKRFSEKFTVRDFVEMVREDLNQPTTVSEHHRITIDSHDGEGVTQWYRINHPDKLGHLYYDENGDYGPTPPSDAQQNFMRPFVSAQAVLEFLELTGFIAKN